MSAPQRLPLLAVVAWLCGASACGGLPCEETPGCPVASELAPGLLSVRTDPAGDIWVIGASPGDGTGPVAAHLEGEAWTRVDTSAWAGAELWWGWIGEDEAVFVGNDGLILELDRRSDTAAAVEGPDSGTTFFGVWGASGDDLWAVGQTEGGEGPPALWRRQAGEWQPFEDTELGPGEAGQTYFKVHGRSADDLWIVGSGGLALHWDGEGLVRTPTDTEVDTSNAPLLTVDASGERPIAVGGLGNAVILELDDGVWTDRSPAFHPGVNGVCAGSGEAWAVGLNGSRARRVDGVWTPDDVGELTPLTRQDWHGCVVDGEGGVWSVGGRIASRPLIDGVIGYQGPAEGIPPAPDW